MICKTSLTGVLNHISENPWTYTFVTAGIVAGVALLAISALGLAGIIPGLTSFGLAEFMITTGLILVIFSIGWVGLKICLVRLNKQAVEEVSQSKVARRRQSRRNRLTVCCIAI